ncbi:hypothetical protein [Crocosphaera sp. XPORK-15E]|uniref:hypothetical protein n=1 Tax=Crocosphaera sp. XPORK-15E TaxID=3110247 RepID=UPI002B1F5735|nr:hypothetical protein [Crocosphaera sp. XPORK-15E]MEA5537041.1 hypothetical protein [Crocosphaera sp. XPORK-15E]
MKFNRRLAQNRRQTIVAIWKQSLTKLLDYYEATRGEFKQFFPKLFIFFVSLNISCYWLALLTAYPKNLL